MIESEIMDEYIYGKLSMDPTIISQVNANIFNRASRKPVNPPIIVFQEHSPPVDSLGVGAVRIMVTGIYIVRAIVQGTSYIPARPIANQIDVVLNRTMGTTLDGQVFYVWRDGIFRMEEDDRGNEYRHLGGIYHIVVQSY